MIHARKDYTRRIQDSDNLIPADEPVFLLRAQDKVAPTVVRVWAHNHRVNGGSDVAYNLAMKQADLMEQWQQVHGCKSADCPPQT